MRRSRELALLGAILLIGAGLRIAYLYDQSRTPRFWHPTSDAGFNDYWAHGLATGQWPAHPYSSGPLIRSMPFFKAPGYPYFLAAVYGATGSSRLGVRLVQMAIGLASCFLLYALGRALFGPVEGLLAAALLAFYWVQIYYEAELHSPVLEVLLILLLFNVVVAFHGRWNFRRALILGLLLGVSVLVRKNLLVLLPCLAVYLAISHKGAARRAMASVSGLCLGLALCILLTAVRNGRAAGELVPISCDAGRNLYLGNNPMADGIHPVFPGQEELAEGGWNLFSYPEAVRKLGVLLEREITCSRAERYFAGRARDYILDQPARVLRLTGKKAVLLACPLEVSSDQVPHFDRQASPVLRRLPGGFAMALAGGAIGAVLAVVDRRRLKAPALLMLSAAFAAGYLATFLPGIAESRYRVGTLPFFFLFSAFACAAVARRLRNPDTVFEGRLWIVGGIILLLLTRVNWAGYVPDLAKWHFENAVAWDRWGDASEAISRYRKVIEANPSHVEARHNLGVLLARGGDYAAAEPCFLAAIQLAPARARTYHSLAAMHIERGQWDEAMRIAESCARAQPHDYRAQDLMGMAVTRQGHFAAAIPYFEKAITLRPDYADGHNNLGVALGRVQRFKEAETHFRLALDLNPSHRDARRNLDLLEKRGWALTPP